MIMTTIDKAWCGGSTAEQGREKNGSPPMQERKSAAGKKGADAYQDQKTGKCQTVQVVKVWHPRTEIITSA